MEAAAPAGAEGDKKSLAFAHRCGTPNPTADILKACARPAPTDFPPDLSAAWDAAHGAAAIQTFSSEVESFVTADSPEVVAERRDFGAIPLIVLTRGERSTNFPPDEAEAEWTVWNKLHEDVARLSTNGVNRVVPGANHYIQLDKPQAVVDAVAEAVAAARLRRP
jgi:pimeloyl-ACP methyl ester carboxylesterase